MRRRHYNWRGYVEGDDGLFALLGSAPTPEAFLQLGFKIKLIPVNDPSLASFCGIISAEGGLIREPIRFISTFGWTFSYLQAGLPLRMGLLRAKALSTIYEMPQCPVSGALARRALIITRGYTPRFVNDGYHPVPPDESAIPQYNPSPAVRALYSQMFGISPQLQVYLESKIADGQELDVSDFPFSEVHSRHWLKYCVDVEP